MLGVSRTVWPVFRPTGAAVKQAALDNLNLGGGVWPPTVPDENLPQTVEKR